ncbi:MAG TPA: hypothetical protein VFF30_18410 [Nitrososphaerales archaeon]|nr:hypothetical protein [Nitrososphaerales archaeon]
MSNAVTSQSEPETKGSGEMKKRSLIAIKGQSLTKADYRGLLALVLVLSFVYLALTGGSCSAITALGPLTGSAVTYYFHSRSNDREVW